MTIILHFHPKKQKLNYFPKNTICNLNVTYVNSSINLPKPALFNTRNLSQSSISTDVRAIDVTCNNSVNL